MTIKQFLIKYRKIEIELLLATVLKKPKEFLFMEPEYELSSHQVKSLSSLIKRREKGEPVAYILGYKDFMGLRFKVNKDVLVPRPETEWLVEKIVSNVKKQVLGKRKYRILDVGTGSGCVIISLAKLLSRFPRGRGKGFFEFLASDASAKALKIARQNCQLILGKNLNTKQYLSFVQSDLFNNLKGQFDVIVANLPYVRVKDYRLRIKDLGYEPKKALTDGTNKWEIYERFFEQIPYHLNANAIIYLEIDPPSKPRLSSLIKKYLPKARVKFHRDFNNLWRYMEIVL